MTRFMDRVYKYSIWLVMSLSMFGYFFYQVLRPSGSLYSTLNDFRTYIHLAFVIYLNITMVSGAFDSGTSQGLQTEEFQLADELNNKLITNVNNELEGFRGYIKALNEHELQAIREDYLFSIGDKKLDELTAKELKAYNNLKPIQHNIYGFNLPLYYELSKNGKVKYQASIKKNQGKRWKQLEKAFIGLLFGSMTVNMIFAWDNVGSALVSLFIISAGLIITFLMTFFPQVFKMKYELPKKVILKNTLYNSYIEYKQGTHVLKKLEEIKVGQVIETELEKTPQPTVTYDLVEST